MSDPFHGLSGEELESIPKKDQPEWTAPMLAVLTDRRFSDENWIYERKLDGERCLVFRKGRSVRILSRNRHELNETYPELVEALRGAGHDFVADGEIVAFERGRTSFSRLQKRMQIRDRSKAEKSGVKVHLYLFDLLHLAGRETAAGPQRLRKRLLRRALDFEDPVRYLNHRNETGEDYYEEACRKGWEGLIAKDANAVYVHSRSRHWLKFKCVNRQELVIGGFTDPRRSRIGFGAILIGYHENGDLKYAGKVGTGFDDEELERLHDRFVRLERKTSPFADRKGREKGVHWVTPKLVAEIGFTEWTSDGKLRHPRYIGLRDDKAPEDVVREKPGA